MTVAEFLKHIDFMTDVEIYDRKDNVLYSGSVIPFHAIAEGEEEINLYKKELYKDEDYAAIQELRKAMAVANRRLDTCNEYEAVGAKSKVNEYGVERFILTITTKKEKRYE